MIPSMASRWAGVKSAAARAVGGPAATSALASARHRKSRRDGMAARTPDMAQEGDRSVGGLDLFRFALDFFGTVVGRGVLGQQPLGTAGLLCRILFLAG